MATEIKLPDLGEGVESGDVLEILVQEGDTVKKGQGIIEVETDKASVEVPSSHAGVVSQIHVAAGQTVKVGAALITLETAAAPAPAAPAAAATPTPPPASATPPSNPPAAEAPADPPTPAPRSPAAPAPAPPQPASQVAHPLAAAPSQAATDRVPSPLDGDPTGHDSLVVPAGPAIRRFAREVGVDLSRVLGTGEGGRITREDVLQVVRSASRVAQKGNATGTMEPARPTSQNPPAAPPSPSSGNSPTPSDVAAAAADAALAGLPPLSTNRNDADPVPRSPSGPSAVTHHTSSDNWGPVQLEKASKIRRTIATKMHESWSTVPRVTNFDDADVTELEEMRQESKADYARQGIKLTTMPFLVKAVAMALKRHPVVNATLDLEQGHIIHKDYVNIGIAVDGDRGLVVPSLRNADQLSVPQLAKELLLLITMVQQNNYGIDDLRGGTFTISNLGAIGGTYSTPIVNVPEVAILLVGRSRKLPVVVEENGADRIVPRLMMPLSLSYDHRLVDGASAARFLNDVIAYLENPRRIVLAP